MAMCPGRHIFGLTFMEAIEGVLIIGILAAIVIGKHRAGTKGETAQLIGKAEAAELKENPAGKMCPLPAAPKADPCKQYHELALSAVQSAEKYGGDPSLITGYFIKSTAYSLLYQNCRDLERRNAEPQKKKAPKCP